MTGSSRQGSGRQGSVAGLRQAAGCPQGRPGCARCCRSLPPGKGFKAPGQPFEAPKQALSQAATATKPRLRNKGSSRALKTPSFLSATSAPPLPSRSGQPLRCRRPCPPPAGGGGWRRASGAEGINRRPGGYGVKAAGLAGDMDGSARERPGPRRGGASPPLRSAPGSHREGEMEGKRCRGQSGLLPPPSALQQGCGFLPLSRCASPRAAAAGAAPSRPGGVARSWPRSGLPGMSSAGRRPAGAPQPPRRGRRRARGGEGARGGGGRQGGFAAKVREG